MNHRVDGVTGAECAIVRYHYTAKQSLIRKSAVAELVDRQSTMTDATVSSPLGQPGNRPTMPWMCWDTVAVRPDPGVRPFGNNDNNNNNNNKSTRITPLTKTTRWVSK